jgi:hypothetical protein
MLFIAKIVYSRQLGTNFWYEFDNFFLWDERQDILKARGNKATKIEFAKNIKLMVRIQSIISMRLNRI